MAASDGVILATRRGADRLATLAKAHRLLPAGSTRHRKAPTVIDDHSQEDIRALFDWRSAGAHDGTHSNGSPVANDDLALALSLLSVNSRDREQFQGGRAPSSH
jgi:hypothetical protein